METTNNYGLKVTKSKKLNYYEAMEQKKEGCDKLKDLLCEYPHCTCMAMRQPVADEEPAEDTVRDTSEQRNVNNEDL